MILCAGKTAGNPYYIEAIGQKVYSLEEINYFIYNHMNLVYRDFFCDALFEYIDASLGCRDMAAKLREMDEAGAGVREFITFVLRESCYYDADDLSRISGFVMNIDNISDAERLKVEADRLFSDKRYGRARALYMDILRARPADPSKDAFYARTAFCVGLCYARLFLCRNANEYFNMAYDIYPDVDYAKAVVYMSLVSGDDEELLRAIIKYRITDEALETIRRGVEKLRGVIKSSEGLAEFRYNVSEREAAARMSEYCKDEYYRMTE